MKVLKPDSFDVITCHDIVLDDVCRPLAVHFVVTRDSIADFCDNCNCWPSWKGYSVQIIFGQAEGIWLWATSMQRTCSCSAVNRYQRFIEIALVCIDIHFPLSVLYWELPSFEYSRDTCYHCAFAITPNIVKTLHTFFQFDFAPALFNLQVSSLRAQGSSPWLDLLLARPDEKCVYY